MKQLKILYAASTASHLRRFHVPYVQWLKQEHDVRLMATEGDGIDFPISFAKSFFSLGNLREILHIRKILKQECFDRVIVHTTLAAFLIRAAMIGMKNRPYVVNVVHGYLFSAKVTGKSEKVLLLCEKLVKKQTDEIVVMNREDLEIATAHRLCLGKISFVNGMGVKLGANAAFDQTLRNSIAPNEELLCTFVGELSKRKNQGFLIRAVSRLRREGLPIHLLLLGEGKERAAFEQEIEAYHAADFVTLAGNREPVTPYLAVTDVYVSAALSEGLPFNVMEAMDAGLPIVATDVKGQNDLLEGTDATLYTVGDEDAFCAAIERLARGARYGATSVCYNNLKQYALDAVFEENRKILMGEENEQSI